MAVLGGSRWVAPGAVARGCGLAPAGPL